MLGAMCFISPVSCWTRKTFFLKKLPPLNRTEHKRPAMYCVVRTGKKNNLTQNSHADILMRGDVPPKRMKNVGGCSCRVVTLPKFEKVRTRNVFSYWGTFTVADSLLLVLYLGATATEWKACLILLYILRVFAHFTVAL